MENTNNRLNSDLIFDAFHSLPEIDDNKLKGCIVRALGYLESELIYKISDSVIFCSLNRTTYGCYLNKNSIRYKGKHFILLSPILLEFNENEAIRIILHEVAHFILKHKTEMDYIDKPGMYDLNETAADNLATQWLKI